MSSAVSGAGKAQQQSASLLCPSSRSDSPSAAVFGMVDNRGPFPIIRYLGRSVRATPEVLALAENEDPHHVFRFTSPCQGEQCSHFAGGECDLPDLLESRMAALEERIGPCPIRKTCRWFYQRSFHACVRCVGIVTSRYALTADAMLNTYSVSDPFAPRSISTQEDQSCSPR